MRNDSRIGVQELKSALAVLSDEEVVRRVRAGDRGLFEVLMRRYNQRVYRAVRSILRDEREVEDAIQQAWLAAYAHLDQFAGASSFSTWLTRIALNEGLARLRQRARLTTVPEVPEEEIHDMRTSPVDPEGRAADRELARMIEEAVDVLPDLYRSVFMLREVEGLSTAEAAACLGVSEEVVKVRLHRARLTLRDALFARAGETSSAAFTFMGARCDRMVARVFDALSSSPVAS
jgi:RNA polymerase sigma-70 factor, ECF subfamily